MIDVRRPDGGLVYRATERQAKLLVAGRVCDEVRTRAGRLRYLAMRRNPPAKKFIATAAQANFTVFSEVVHGSDRSGLVWQHKRSRPPTSCPRRPSISQSKIES